MQQVSESASLPEESLLCAYRDQGAYTDCFTLDAPFVISHAEYVTAFYTSRLDTSKNPAILRGYCLRGV